MILMTNNTDDFDTPDENDAAVNAAAFLSPTALAEAAANTQSLIDSGDYETFGSCILTEADILAGRDDDCTMHDHEA